ncbi:PAS domain S-box protein [Desulfobacula sp.]|uniref:PAS domain-containing hybrid sensor histidine kinase/response regulator n=1 Tax=Desulfobacula sp. TaxID=2593537 RepID=UPI001D771788|nr:PAS domain S-box protein [Desulfobacula sp.]
MTQKPTYEELEEKIKNLQQMESDFRQNQETPSISRQKLALHFLQTPLAVIEWDLDFKVRSWNPAAEKIFGYKKNEILGKHASIIIPEEYKAKTDIVWQDLIKQKGGTRSTNENLTKKGEIIFCEWFNTPIIDDSGNTIAVFSQAQNMTARRLAEYEREKSISLLKATLESTADGILAVDRNGTWTEFNQKFLDIWNIPASIRDIGKAKATLDYVINSIVDSDTFLSKMKTLYQKPEDSSFEIISLKDGRILEQYSQPQWLRQKIVGRVWTIKDITHHKQTEKKLQASQKRFLTVLNSLDATIYVADFTTYEILFMNDYMKKVFKKDATGKICWDIFRASSGPCSNCTNNKLLDENKKPTGVCIWQGQNPVSKRWYVNYDRAIEWTDGQMVKLQIAIDITDQKKAEEKLLQSEGQYREYFEGIFSGTYISNPDGKLIACNKEYKNIFGFGSTQQAMDTPIKALCVNPDERVGFLNLLKNKKQITGYEPNLKKIDGTRLNLIENSSGVFDEKGNLVQIRGFLLDITEQKKLETQLMQAQKMEAIGTLAGGIAHDFNNILTGIFGYAQLAEIHINQPEKAKEHIAQLVKSGQRAAALIRQILTFSKQSEFKKHPLSVYILLKEALKLIRSSIPSNISIKENIFSKAMIIADPTQIHQVIMNLCTNAYQAMSNAEGLLTVGLDEIEIFEQKNFPGPEILKGNYIRLEIIDTGPGINKKNMERIFDPYFTTKETGKGTGLGLAVVDGIVKKQKGFIKAYSKAGHGSKFQVFWPIIEQSIVPEAFVKKETDLFTGTETIMLVDDEADILKTLQIFLQRRGYKIQMFNDGKSALKAFIESPQQFDLIVTDMTMPHMTGDKLSREIFKIRKDMPIILCTGYSETFSENKARKIGICKYVQKPITGSDLAALIREVLDKKIIN